MTTPEKMYRLESGAEYPLFAFDEPQIVTLPNGTRHRFRLPDDVTEKRREDSLKTVVVTSPHLLNGENPRDVKTDYSRSQLAYYEMMIDAISGVRLGENADPETWYIANKGVLLDDGTSARVIDLIGAPVRRAAAARLYGGKIEVERPGEDEAEESTEGFDPFADETETDITEEIEKREKQRELYRLTMERTVIIRHEVGIETVNGRATPPTHVMRHFFREPTGADFSKWELKAYRGFAVSLPKGGERAERYYNLDTIRTLYDSLIDRIEGASVNGEPINLSTDRNDPARIATLAKVPLAIKKTMVATLFAEMSNLGNF